MATFGDKMRAELNKHKNADNNEIIKINESYIEKFIEKCKRQMENNVSSRISIFDIEYSLENIKSLNGVDFYMSKMIIQNEVIYRLLNEGLKVSIIDSPCISESGFQFRETFKIRIRL